MNNQLDLIVEHLASIADSLSAIRSVMERKQKRSERDARHYDKVCAQEAQQATESVAKESESKEGESKEVGKEDISPEPPIEERAEEKKEGEKKDKEKIGGGINAREEGWFEEFWAAYPNVRKFNKSECLNRFKEILASATTDKGREKLVADILGGLERWKKSYLWTKDGGKFVCSTLVWLNNERWRDKVDSAAEVTSRENATKAKKSLMGNIKHGADWRGIRPEDVENVF